VTRTAAFLVLAGALHAVMLTEAWAQTAALPRTYSFSAVTALLGREMGIQVNRNDARELIEETAISKPGETGHLHIRILYDFQAKRIFSVNLNSNLCTTQQYVSPYAPGLMDPIGAVSETAANLAGMPAAWIPETVNGIAVRTAEVAMPEGAGKEKFWLEEKYGFLVKMALGMGSEPLTTRFEMKELSYAPSPAALFTEPRNCQAIEGVTDSNGGHAEMTIGTPAPSQRAAAPEVQSKITAVRLRIVPESYAGACPSPVVLAADITTNGPGVVWYRFLAGAVFRNGPSEGTVIFSVAGTKTVTLEGTIRTTPAVGQTSLIAAMEDEKGNHGPQTVSSGPVNYNRTCQ